MKKSNKKGFTIVELVIVIAVIAILAAVLIPTFSGVVEKANESKALQSAKNAYTALLVLKNGDIAVSGKVDAYIVVDTEHYYKVDEGKLEKCDKPNSALSDNATTETEDWELVSSTDLKDVPETIKVYIYTPATQNT